MKDIEEEDENETYDVEPLDRFRSKTLRKKRFREDDDNLFSPSKKKRKKNSKAQSLFREDHQHSYLRKKDQGDQELSLDLSLNQIRPRDVNVNSKPDRKHGSPKKRSIKEQSQNRMRSYSKKRSKAMRRNWVDHIFKKKSKKPSKSSLTKKKNRQIQPKRNKNNPSPNDNIDHTKTLTSLLTNKPVELYLLADIKRPNQIQETPKSNKKVQKKKNLSIWRYFNYLSMIHLCLYQVLIPALPLLPGMLLGILTIIEVVFFLIVAIPYTCTSRYVVGHKLLAKVFRLIFMGSFYLICLMINLSGDGDKKPVNESIQKAAISSLLLGLIAEYIMFVIGMVLVICQGCSGMCSGKKKKKVEPIIFYKAKISGEEEEKRPKEAPRRRVRSRPLGESFGGLGRGESSVLDDLNSPEKEKEVEINQSHISKEKKSKSRRSRRSPLRSRQPVFLSQELRDLDGIGLKFEKSDKKEPGSSKNKSQRKGSKRKKGIHTSAHSKPKMRNFNRKFKRPRKDERSDREKLVGFQFD